MAQLFRAVQSPILNQEGKRLWHPQLVKIGKAVTTQEVARMIAQRSSLSEGDTHNVMRNLPYVLKDLLTSSRSVNIEGLGTFRLSCTSKGGVETAEEVNANQIKRLRILFSPTFTRNPGEGTTRSMFTGIQYVKYETALKNPQATDPVIATTILPVPGEENNVNTTT